MLRRAALGKRVKSTIAAMAEVLEGRDGPEGASLLRSRLEPQEARTTAVTKQAAAPGIDYRILAFEPGASRFRLSPGKNLTLLFDRQKLGKRKEGGVVF